MKRRVRTAAIKINFVIHAKITACGYLKIPNEIISI